jgi:hypothetical protein
MALIMASPASAAGAKFHSTSSSVTNTGALVVSFDERGLGTTSPIDYTLSADAEATYACINGGNKHPQAANKETKDYPVAGNTSVEPKNGRVVSSITATPAPSAGEFSCPGGQRLVLADVSYTNIWLTDTTNGVTTQVAPVSKTFFAV